MYIYIYIFLFFQKPSDAPARNVEEDYGLIIVDVGVIFIQ
jgi:hypothetical protein